MTVLRVDTLSGIGTDGPVFDGDLEFNSQNYVILPKGTTSDRVGVGSTAGALRYNTDSNKVELYDGNQWTEVQASRPDLNGGARGLIAGGYAAPASINVIEYIAIATTGNGVDFGDLTSARSNLRSVSSTTRGVFAGGSDATPALNTMDYITVSSTGDAQDFGDLLQGRGGRPSSCSNSTRGIIMGGYGPAPSTTDVNSIDYITISSTGNAQDFGDMLAAADGSLQAGCSSSTRGISAGSYGPNTNIIQYLTIASTGNTQDFGDLTQVKRNADAASSPTRGVIMGGVVFPGTTAWTNVIEFITIATLGNGTDFGDLTQDKLNGSACSSPTRAIYACGSGPFASPAAINVIEYFEISTLGNAVNFGDLVNASESSTALSNAHGGL